MRGQEQEIKSITELNEKSDELADEAIKATKSKREAVIYARKTFKKEDLNSYYCLGNLSDTQMIALNTKTSRIKFSIDSMIKNKINHPDITLNDYRKVGNYIKNANYILKQNDLNLIYFKKKDKLYRIVVKTTQDKKENFLTSFTRCRQGQLTEALKKYKQIK